MYVLVYRICMYTAHYTSLFVSLFSDLVSCLYLAIGCRDIC